ncbi:MAG: NADH-quinone oxidoreductase subunit L [Bacteroidota bacterium]
MTDTIIQEINLQLPAILIPLLPLIGFFLNALFGKKIGHASGWIATLAITGSFICSLYLFFNLPAGASQTITLTNWFHFKNIIIPFAFLIDPLTITMLLVITGIGSLIHLYSIGYMHHDEGFSRFFSYLNLFVFFMLLLVMGNNYLIMFIGWEGVGLCSYLLIGFWFKNQAYNDAAKKAFIMNRIGDLGFLIGMFMMLFYFNSLTYTEVMSKASTLSIGNPMIVFITLFLFVGAMGKSAQLPLYTWLPDAMAGPTPVSALIHAATMVTAGIYMIARSNVLYALAPFTLDIVLIVGVVTSLFAAIIGLLQTDIKKVLAYSTVSQLGLMFAAMGMGAFESGMFHVVTHAVFKALLFLGAGSVIHALSNEQDMRNMGGLNKFIKVTYLTFLIGTIAISGIPPFAGFFSKDEILATAFEHNKIIWGLLSFSSMLTAFYMFRLVYVTFYNNYRGTDEVKSHIHESPAVMTIPLIILAACSVVIGFIGLPPVISHTHSFKNYLSSVFTQSKQILPGGHEMSHATEWILIATAVVLAIVSIAFAYTKYVMQKQTPVADSELKGVSKLVANKFYVDEIYDTVFVKPIMLLSDLFLVLIDKLIIDLFVHAVAFVTTQVGRLLRLIQTGHVGFYMFAMVVSMIILLAVQIYSVVKF